MAFSLKIDPLPVLLKPIEIHALDKSFDIPDGADDVLNIIQIDSFLTRYLSSFPALIICFETTVVVSTSFGRSTSVSS